MGYSPWGLKESDITEGTEHACTCVLTHTHTHTQSQLYIIHNTLASLSVTLKFHGGGQLGKKCLKRLLKEEIMKNWLRKL